MPLSVQIAFLIPIEIISSFICAPLLYSVALPVTIVGGVASVVAILHLTIANSDLHRWFSENMAATSSALSDNPLAGMAQQIGNLAVNAIQLNPGAGLYVLAAALSLTTVLFHSRILAAISSSESAPPPSADTQTWLQDKADRRST
jgi:hypothetical protein